MSLFYQLAKHLNAVANKVWLLWCCIAHFESCFARKYQNTKRTSIVRHLDIGVDTVTYHCHLISLVAEASENTRQHIWIWLTKCNIRATICGVSDTLTY